jgi:hypothetical protein
MPSASTKTLYAGLGGVHPVCAEEPGSRVCAEEPGSRVCAEELGSRVCAEELGSRVCAEELGSRGAEEKMVPAPPPLGPSTPQLKRGRGAAVSA